MTTLERANLVTENNLLGLQEYDLVKTVGKGIGIVLKKPSLDNELVVYSMSSFTETHPNDDDGMAKVRRYNEDGTICLYSEKTGRKLKNRDIYAIEGIVGVKSYTNPIIAMKDFINQNEDIEFDPVVVDEPEIDDVAETSTETPTEMPTQMDIMMQMMQMMAKMTATLDKVTDKLDNIADEL